MSDTLPPRPQYGEYATPEEQRQRAGLPPVAPAAAPPPPPAAAAPQRAGTGYSADRLITLALLAYGLINVLFTATAYFDLPSVMDDTMRFMGIEGEFTNIGPARTWGVVAALVLAAGWMITAVLTIRRLRRGKRSWWLPLVGALVTMIVVGICLTVPMMGDPAFLSYIDGFSG